jgi:hypothetical protein
MKDHPLFFIIPTKPPPEAVVMDECEASKKY